MLTKCTVLYTRWRFIQWITLSMFRTIGARCMVRVSKKSQLPAVYHCLKTSNWRLFILWANFSVWVLLYITAVYCTINSSLLIKVLKSHVKLQLSSFNIMGWVESWFMTSLTMLLVWKPYMYARNNLICGLKLSVVTVLKDVMQ